MSRYSLNARGVYRNPQSLDTRGAVPITPRPAIGLREFVVLTAALMSCQALAVDMMLPALASIAGELGVVDENRSQWVITSYIAGLGAGQLFWGSISDRFGRRPVLLVGLALYAAAGASAGVATSFRMLLALRFLHGIAGSSLVVSRSVIRDLYEGRPMARVMSLTFIVFVMVPVIAPSLGQLVLWLAPWRTLFGLFAVFAALVWIWVFLRLPETLHPQFRLTLKRAHLAHAARAVLSDRASCGYTLGAALLFGSIISYVGMVPQIYAEVFRRPDLMPGLFALCAASMGVASFLNSRIVERFGMRIISHTALVVFIGITMVHTVVAASGSEPLWLFVTLQALTLGCLGLILANFGSMAMESMGPIAGIAASLQGCTSTVGGAVVAMLVGRQFHGSTLPLALGAALSGVMALMAVMLAERGRLFQPHHAEVTGFSVRS